MIRTNKKQLFSTTVSKGLEAIDDNVILGASIIQMGEVNDDRNWVVDETTLEQVVEFGSQGRKGLKARFTHPNMSNDGLGTHLGYWRNFRVDGDRVRADLYLSESAFNTPKGDLGTYVLELAEEDPEVFGVSVASRIDWEAMSLEEGDIGEGLDEPVPLRFAALRAADFVDEPGATRGGLFAESMSLDQRLANVDIAAMFTWILDTHFDAENPDEIRDRCLSALNRYFSNKGIEMTQQKPAETPVASGPDGKAYMEAFGERGAVWFVEGKPFEECFQLRLDELSAEVTALKEENADLKARLEAVNLGETDPVPASPASTDPDPEGEKKPLNHDNLSRVIRIPASN